MQIRTQIFCDGDFNFFFNSQLEADGGKPNFQSTFVGKFFEIKNLQICETFEG